MEQLERVETLREKTGCSYSEAKAALEETNGDLLEALCWLENHGKAQLVGVSCSTEDREPPKPEPEPAPKEKKEPGPVVNGFRSLWDGLVGLIRKCNRTELIMTGKRGQREFSIPLTLVIILLLTTFWVVVALIVVALFFGNRFSVEGSLGSDNVNEVLNKATDFAEGIREEAFPDKNEEQKK